jgi:hypothetical protein
LVKDVSVGLAEVFGKKGVKGTKVPVFPAKTDLAKR